jgi:hypothetical protein
MTSKDWTKTANRFAYIARASETRNEASQRCCVRSLCLHGVILEVSVLPCDVIAACSSPPVARDDTERTPLPLLRHSVYSVARRLADGYLTNSALLRNPTMGWHVTIYISDCTSSLSCIYVYNVPVTVAEPSKAAFLKLWSADHKWSSRCAFVVLQKDRRKTKFKWIAYHTIAENLRVWKLHIAIFFHFFPSTDIL